MFPAIVCEDHDFFITGAGKQQPSAQITNLHFKLLLVGDFDVHQL